MNKMKKYENDLLIGNFCIVWNNNDSVYAGYISAIEDTKVLMEDGFCLWYYSGAASINQLALEGVKKPDECKFSVAVPTIFFRSVQQIYLCTKEAEKNLKSVKKWKV